MTSIGLVLGVMGALLGGELMRAMLVGVQPRDVETLVVVSAILFVVAVLAAVVPARRATAVSPTEALRGG